MPGPRLDKLRERETLAARPEAGAPPIGVPERAQQPERGLTLECEAREQILFAIVAAVAVRFPHLGGHEVEGRLLFGEETLESEAELERFGVAKVRQNHARGPLAVRSGVERLVIAFDDQVGERLGRLGEPFDVVGRFHAGIVAGGFRETSGRSSADARYPPAMVDLAERRVRVNGIELAYVERPGSGPPILFAHATGFHARCWDAVVELLPERRCVAVDLRGHGRSEVTPPPYPWSLFADDTTALGEALGLEGAIGVGHSMGGFVVVAAAAARPAGFAALLLVDPVIMAPEVYRREAPPPGEHFAARRRNAWASPEEMYERFKERPPFARWQPRVLRDYCEHGLRPAPEGGGYVLACPPEVEAAIYAGNRHADPYPLIERVAVPVRVLRARPQTPGGPLDMSASPTVPDLASRFRLGEDVFLPERSHFIPMETPELVARHVEEIAARAGT